MFRRINWSVFLRREGGGGGGGHEDDSNDPKDSGNPTEPQTAGSYRVAGALGQLLGAEHSKCRATDGTRAVVPREEVDFC